MSAVLAAGAALTWPAYGASLLDAYRAMLEQPSPAYSLLTRQGQGAVSREGYWLVGPEGLLDKRYERPLLAISSRPALALIFLRPLELGYRLMYKVGRLLRPGNEKVDLDQDDRSSGRSSDKR